MALPDDFVVTRERKADPDSVDRQSLTKTDGFEDDLEPAESLPLLPLACGLSCKNSS